MSAFVFPGQGSQAKGMLKNLSDRFETVAITFAEASETLGYDLWDVVQNDSHDLLNQTHVTQPALLASSVSIFKVIQEATHVKPRYLAGHSLGEYSALTCAGVFDFKDAIKLVEARGKFMQTAVPSGTGAMFAIIGLDDKLISEACVEAQAATNEVVAAVNFNSPGQVVIAGTVLAASAAAELCKEKGAKRALSLAVSVPSHCALMQPAADQLEEMLCSVTLNSPTINVVNNVDVKVQISADAIKDALIRQLYMPVRWTESIQYLKQQGITKLYELGPGKVLTGLTKRIDKSLQAISVNDVVDIENI